MGIDALTAPKRTGGERPSSYNGLIVIVLVFDGVGHGGHSVVLADTVHHASGQM
jgi:hypothetical protein